MHSTCTLLYLCLYQLALTLPVSFVGMISTATAGGTVTNFSNRFTLTGMTGSFPPDVIVSNKNIVGTAGPATVNQVAEAPAAGKGTIDAGAWGTPYDEQLGPTRYAPMQPIPGTKITATNTKPLWPTSSVPIATTFLPPLGAKLVTTQTQPQTYKAASHANTVSSTSVMENYPDNLTGRGSIPSY